MKKKRAAMQYGEAAIIMLLKVNIATNWQNNLKPPTTNLPGGFLGQPGAMIGVKMGSNYSMNVKPGGLTSSMILTLIVVPIVYLIFNRPQTKVTSYKRI
ncbi:MAG: hypothetical protein QM786_08030 [Breznakibacter sp.]